MAHRINFILLRDFLLGQGATQVIQALTGLIIVRYLSAEQFAILTLAFAFQTTASIYTEMGVGAAILPLVGQNTEDRTKLMRLVSAAFQLRYLYFGIVSVVCIWLFLVTSQDKGWNPLLTASLLGSILLTLWSSGNINIYSVPLRIRKDLKGIYLAQVLPGVSRLFIVIVLFIAGLANAANLAWIAALAVVAGGWMIQRRADLPHTGNWQQLKPERRNLLAFTIPLIPGTIFYALQGQLLVFLAAAFSSTARLAELGALGRLGILFALAGALAGQVIAPWFAKLPLEELTKNYFIVVSGYLTLIGIAVIVASSLPTPFLWILGPQYSHLSGILPLAFFGSTLALLCGALWTLNHSRGWIYWWGELMNIPAVIITQLAGFIILGSETLNSLYWIVIAGQVATAIVYLAVSFKGLRGSIRQMKFSPT